MMKLQISGLAKLFASVLLITVSFLSPAQEISKDPAVISAGEAIFNGNCKTCHRVKTKLIGPALAGVETRVPSIDWIKNWVRNPAKVIASGDEYANKIYNEYQKSQMTAFSSYTDDQIMSILAYVKAEAEKPDAVATTATPSGGQSSEGVPSAYMNAILIGMVIILLLLLIQIFLKRINY